MSVYLQTTSGLGVVSVAQGRGDPPPSTMVGGVVSAALKGDLAALGALALPAIFARYFLLKK